MKIGYYWISGRICRILTWASKGCKLMKLGCLETCFEEITLAISTIFCHEMPNFYSIARFFVVVGFILFFSVIVLSYFLIWNTKKLLLDFKKFLHLKKIVPEVFAFIEFLILGITKFPAGNFRLPGLISISGTELM